MLALHSFNACNIIPKSSTISSDKVPGKLLKHSLYGGIVFPKTLITHVLSDLMAKVKLVCATPFSYDNLW